MSIKIRTESPLTPDSRRLIDESEAALRAVFPPDECFSFSAEELATPNTQFLVARLNGQAHGCVALVDQVFYGEVKRLFVAPEARGLGLARALMSALEAAAEDIGLTCLRLETGHALTEAVNLYRTLGFYECDAFGDYPDIPSNLFLGKSIGSFVRQGSGKTALPASGPDHRRSFPE
ncbi:MAG: GNAT family N-acetyltransferase [Confluentimicrobium sp.]|uniref:GNAT family N-acetyltransferase n=1 Tax=Actibacterium sp. TaxID=1872125 RepID=UPI000C462090|nr:GNAT family N-acetyltransferase [Actibacterium sp.]MBC56792.1 GNAT family N-acetyltransferase [Actibacterium sp.]|tara:strand:+ start:1031 stop:1561 length:531 start_codon:yes stop_codon:yes gene_type:complete